jgi:hypothetical protein
MPQAVYDYEQLHRDRLAARDARLAAEQRQHELAALRHAHASLRLDLALLELKLILEGKHRPDQPRVPAGNGDESGRWTSEGRGGSNPVSRARRVAEVINICVLSGKSLFTNEFGVKSFKAWYECPGGQTVTREGFGHSPRGFIRDPYR